MDIPNGFFIQRFKWNNRKVAQLTLRAYKGYLTARDFLRAFSCNSLTFTSYRTHIQRPPLLDVMADQYPVLLIDESQDTNGALMDAFLTAQ